jgi:hypothetical protein
MPNTIPETNEPMDTSSDSSPIEYKSKLKSLLFAAKEGEFQVAVHVQFTLLIVLNRLLPHKIENTAKCNRPEWAGHRYISAVYVYIIAASLTGILTEADSIGIELCKCREVKLLVRSYSLSKCCVYLLAAVAARL